MEKTAHSTDTALIREATAAPISGVIAATINSLHPRYFETKKKVEKHDQCRHGHPALAAAADISTLRLNAALKTKTLEPDFIAQLRTEKQEGTQQLQNMTQRINTLNHQLDVIREKMHTLQSSPRTASPLAWTITASDRGAQKRKATRSFVLKKIGPDETPMWTIHQSSIAPFQRWQQAENFTRLKLEICAYHATNPDTKIGDCYDSDSRILKKESGIVSLNDVIEQLSRNHQHIAIDESEKLLTKLLSAVEKLHNNGFTHGDLSTETLTLNLGAQSPHHYSVYIEHFGNQSHSIALAHGTLFQWGHGTAQAHNTLLTSGQILRQEREKLGLNIDQVAGSLGLSKQDIRDIENYNYDRFPSAIYLGGYLRSYAKLVKLSEDALFTLCSGLMHMSLQYDVGRLSCLHDTRPTPQQGFQDRDRCSAPITFKLLSIMDDQTPITLTDLNIAITELNKLTTPPATQHVLINLEEYHKFVYAHYNPPDEPFVRDPLVHMPEYQQVLSIQRAEHHQSILSQSQIPQYLMALKKIRFRFHDSAQSDREKLAKIIHQHFDHDPSNQGVFQSNTHDVTRFGLLELPWRGITALREQKQRLIEDYKPAQSTSPATEQRRYERAQQTLSPGLFRIHTPSPDTKKTGNHTADAGSFST